MGVNKFVDFYDLLHISSNADTKTIERSFRHLTKKLNTDQFAKKNNA